MKKYVIAFLCGAVLFAITGCSDRKTEEDFTAKVRQENTEADRTKVRQESTAVDRTKSSQTITWEEITGDGVDEQELFSNIDTDLLEEIADLLQALDREIAEKESASSEYVLRSGWVEDVAESEQYNKVISMGNEAVKPLYWIIYKSESQGRYEYICALALEELSGFDFDEDGDGIKWASSKELLEELNEKILEGE